VRDLGGEGASGKVVTNEDVVVDDTVQIPSLLTEPLTRI
jgi:hypothetical protein